MSLQHCELIELSKASMSSPYKKKFLRTDLQQSVDESRRSSRTWDLFGLFNEDAKGISKATVYDRKSIEESSGRSSTPGTIYYFRNSNNWHLKAFRELKSFQYLSKGWNGYEAEVPNHVATFWTEEVLKILHERSPFAPTGLAPSAEGGVSIYFMKGKKYADIECFNSEEILGVISDSQTEPIVWEVNPSEEGILEALERIHAFISK